MAGAATRLLTPDEIAQAYPFYALGDIVPGSLNTVDEGYFDSMTMFEWMRRQAREGRVVYLENEVVGVTSEVGLVESVTLATGETVRGGQVVNASGPRAAQTAAMAGISLPVEPPVGVGPQD